MKTIKQKIGAEAVVKRPPLGLKPRQLWKEQILRERIHDICDAAQRYYNAKKPIPQEWLDELTDHASELIKTYAAAVVIATGRGQK